MHGPGPAQQRNIPRYRAKGRRIGLSYRLSIMRPVPKKERLAILLLIRYKLAITSDSGTTTPSPDAKPSAAPDQADRQAHPPDRQHHGGRWLSVKPGSSGFKSRPMQRSDPTRPSPAAWPLAGLARPLSAFDRPPGARRRQPPPQNHNFARAAGFRPPPSQSDRWKARSVPRLCSQYMSDMHHNQPQNPENPSVRGTPGYSRAMIRRLTRLVFAVVMVCALIGSGMAHRVPSAFTAPAMAMTQGRTIIPAMA
jgi:hypothetical protein